KNTFNELWKNNIIPIANENDVVSNLELKFSDNDELAALIAVGFDASFLLMASSVDGLFDTNGELIPFVDTVDDTILGLATTAKSSVGLGGMVSKLTFARLATRMGIHTVIFGLRQPESILRAVEGSGGTQFAPRESTATPRQKWLASGSLVIGSI